MKKNYYIKYFLILLSLSWIQPQRIFAQDNLIEISEDTTVIDSIDESSEVLTEQGDETTQTNNLQMNNQMNQFNFKDYVPYAKFVNYQYQGDGTLFSIQDIIMEYPPDDQGIFQVSAFTGDRAVAYIYQIRDNGMFELAYFDNYNVVEDLRYSAMAQDSEESLILPLNIAVGQSYQSGYQRENKRSIVELISVFNLGGYNFQNVLKVLEVKPTTTDSFYYYFAPDYGIILVEKIDASGNVSPLIQLISTQGNLMP